MSIKESDFDFESMKDLALEQLRSGESLYGKNVAFAPLMKKFLEAALEAEIVVTASPASRFAPQMALSRSILRVTVGLTSNPSLLRNVRRF